MPRSFLCINLLKSFSTKEIEDLGHIVSCRYFNTDQYVVKLFEVLKKIVLNKNAFTEELQLKVYQKVFGDIPLSNNSLNKKQKGILNAKMNLLLRLAEQLLSIEAMETDNIIELLYPKLLEKQQTQLFSRHINRLKKSLENETRRGITFYDLQYKLMSSFIDNNHIINKLPKLNDFENLEYYLDIHYLIRKLEIHLAILSLGRAINSSDYDFTSLSTIKSLLMLPQYSEHSLISVYRANIELEKYKTEETYFNLLDTLDRKAHTIPFDILRAIYTNITNYCISQIRQGNTTYNQHIFELYKIMHKKKLLIDNGLVSIQILKNFLTMACRNDDFLLAETLIYHYKDFLPNAVKESVCFFLWGVIAFHQKNYEAAHESFTKVEQVNLNFDINTRTLLLKCLYEKEQDYNEYTMTAFRSAERFFKLNKQLPKRNKKAYFNFIKLLIALYRVRSGVGSRTLEWIAQELELQDVNSDAHWLLEKIEELK